MRWHVVAVLVEVCLRDHERVSEAAVVSGIFDFLGEDVGAVDLARDVDDTGSGISVSFSDFVFFEVEMFSAFGGNGCGPVDTGLVVVKYFCCVRYIEHADVGGTVLDV